MTDVYVVASALYAGGWRSDDREELAACPDYEFTADELDDVCAVLAQIKRVIEEGCA